jgi:hypothetical protein
MSLYDDKYKTVNKCIKLDTFDDNFTLNSNSSSAVMTSIKLSL